MVPPDHALERSVTGWAVAVGSSSLCDGGFMEIRTVLEGDIEPTVEALESAFAADPLIGFFFGQDAKGKGNVAEFFRILLSVRVQLEMPVLLAESEGTPVGAVMGTDVSRPQWPETYVARWAGLMERVAGLESRLEEYARLAAQFEPEKPHYYLGVIGVREGRKGSGVGAALLNSFCDRSDRDKESTGVFLETASEPSCRFYLKNGFRLTGEGLLGGDTRLWCVFRETSRRTTA
jgi:GNAT superfamily N-acetyltransferase